MKNLEQGGTGLTKEDNEEEAGQWITKPNGQKV